MKIPAGQIETIRNAIETLIKQPLNQPVESIAAADLSTGAGDMDQLVAALGQLVDIMTRVEADRGASETMTPGADSDLEITEIGEYGFGLYQNLASRATDAEQKTAYSNLAIDLALWIARHNGQIDTLEPVVDALAQLANSAHTGQSHRAHLGCDFQYHSSGSGQKQSRQTLAHPVTESSHHCHPQP